MKTSRAVDTNSAAARKGTRMDRSRLSSAFAGLSSRLTHATQSVTAASTVTMTTHIVRWGTLLAVIVNLFMWQDYTRAQHQMNANLIRRINDLEVEVYVRQPRPAVIPEAELLESVRTFRKAH